MDQPQQFNLHQCKDNVSAIIKYINNRYADIIMTKFNQT